MKILQRSDTCPFDLLREIMSNYKREPVDDIPFCGGAIGHIAYDYEKNIKLKA